MSPHDASDAASRDVESRPYQCQTRRDVRKGVMITTQQPGLTPMDLGRYYMRRMARRVDAEHFQELYRTVAYAIDPAQTAYNLAVHYGVTDLPTPAEIWRAGTLPD